MSRYIVHLIEDARDSSENDDFTSETGIQDREFIRYLNEGQQRLHNKITQQHPRVFEKDVTYTLSRAQETVTLPDDIHVKNMVTQVEYSYNGSEENYYVLNATSMRNRQSGIQGTPSHYFVRNNKVFLSPEPNDSSASLRVSYVRRVNNLGKRMAQVDAVTLLTDTISSLTVDVNSVGVDSTSLERADEYFTIVDSQGNIKMNDIKFDSIDTSTGVVTINSSFTFDSGETIASGDWLISNRSGSSHIDTNLTDMAERYIEQFCIYKILKRDSSVDSQEAMEELGLLEVEIVDSYKEIPNDVTQIPQINEEPWF